MTLALYLAGIVLCLLLSAFFSGAEMCCSSCNQLRLESARDDGSKRAVSALYLTAHYEQALSAILIGNNLVNIAASSLASVVMVLVTGGTGPAWAATAVLTVLIIIFGETIPKIAAKKNANVLMLRYAYLLRALTVILYPLIWVVLGLIRLLTLPMKQEPEEEPPEEAVEELQSIIETAEDEEVLDKDRSELVHAAIDFSEISAFEAMTARVDMEALDIEDSREDLLKKIDSTPYTRLPVYEGSVDHIIGILHLNAFLKAMTEEEHPDIRSLLMPPCYVYRTMKLPAVMNEMKKAKQHLAVVSDEYGGTLGVISMEDILEQIVGEIWDENDTVEPEVIRREDGSMELDGDMVIADFLELLGIREDDFEAESATVGGWTIERFGGYPAEGDSFDFRGRKITVLRTDGRRVASVLVGPAAEAAPET